MRRIPAVILILLASGIGCSRAPLADRPGNEPETSARPPPPDPAPDPQPDPCDQDGDGHVAVSCGGDDCDDGNATIHPGAPDQNAAIGPWATVRVIESTGGTSSGTAIAVDRGGGVHIAYYGGGNAGLLYARRTGPDWLIEPIAPLRLVSNLGDETPAIALDAGGSVHLAFMSPAGIQHATRGARRGDGWVTEVVDPTGHGRVAMAIESTGAVHLAYPADIGLVHATNRTGSWLRDLVDAAGVAPSLAVEAAGTVHVAYALATQNAEALRHATGVGGVWQVETASQTRTGSTSMVLDGSGAPHIALAPKYTTDMGVRYLVPAGGRWSETIVPATSDIYSATLRLDAAGTPHVLFSYLIETHYAVLGGDGSWQAQPIVIVGDSDVRPSLDLDAAGAAHIASTSFLFTTLDNLEYTTNRRIVPDGVDQDCDGVDGVDGDRDGHASLATGGDDCADDDPASEVGCRSSP